MFAFILIIIVGVICGCVTDKINKDKGYESGFAWGFFLGVIGIAIVALRTEAPQKKPEDSKSNNQ